MSKAYVKSLHDQENLLSLFSTNTSLLKFYLILQQQIINNVNKTGKKAHFSN